MHIAEGEAVLGQGEEGKGGRKVAEEGCEGKLLKKGCMRRRGTVK